MFCNEIEPVIVQVTRSLEFHRTC